MTGRSASTVAKRLREAYENLPLPLPIVAALALDLLLGRLRPIPLPGSLGELFPQSYSEYAERVPRYLAFPRA